MAAGTYSSICIATPMAVQLKDREPVIKAHTARVLSKRGPAPAVAPADDELAKPVKVPVAAAPSRPVTSSGSAKRNQPTRTTRSKRPKGQR
jgi:preprotein translocase subunit SecF